MVRRVFLQMFGSLLSLSSRGKTTSIEHLLPNGTPSFAAFFYDERCAPAKVVAADFQRSGVLAVSTTGDLRDVWSDRFKNILRNDGVPIAGLTTYPDFVTAKICGREPGVRFALRNDCSRFTPGRIGDRELTLFEWCVRRRALQYDDVKASDISQPPALTAAQQHGFRSS